MAQAAQVRAQHTEHEIAVAFAQGGQLPFADAKTNGFFTGPTIARIQYQAWTSGVQSVSAFAENVHETRTRGGLWQTVTVPVYNARLSESLSMITVGATMVRTLFSQNGIRLGAGVGLGWGLGKAKMHTESIDRSIMSDETGCQTWQGLLAEAYARVRWTVYSSSSLDVGLTGTARYWGFPYLGPIGTCPGSYNGPEFRTLQTIGYLAGLSLGF